MLMLLRKRMFRLVKFVLLSILIFGNAVTLFSQTEEKEEEDDYRWNLLPSPSFTYSPETDVVLGGFLLWQFKMPKAGRETRSSRASLWIAFSQKGQSFFDTRHTIFTSREKYFLDGIISVRFFTEQFFGIGPNTKEENAVKAEYDAYEFKQRVLRGIKPKVFAGLQYRYIRIDKLAFKDKEDNVITPPRLAGTSGSQESGLGAAFSWDKRNRVITPTQDFYLDLSLFFYGPYIGGDHSFTDFKIDGRRYLNFNTGEKHVLALQGIVTAQFGEVPFREYGMIGGSLINRGYLQGRYRDKFAVQFQAEYRVNLIGRFGMTVFAGIGQVNNKLAMELFSNIKNSAGFGFRFNVNKKDPANVRLDFGFTKESYAFYIGFGEAF